MICSLNNCFHKYDQKLIVIFVIAGVLLCLKKEEELNKLKIVVVILKFIQVKERDS